ncbi:MAG: hypothetical protein RH859_01970 [Longimicrobiales bacterium]
MNAQADGSAAAQDDRLPFLVSYRVDAEGVLVATGGDWTAFAEEAGAPELRSDLVVGRPLDDFVSGRKTRAVYRALRERITDTGRPVTFPYRCDAPELRRWMTMEMRPLPGGQTLFRTWPTAVESRPAAPVGHRKGSKGRRLLMCGWCKRVVLGSAWYEIEDALARSPLHDGATSLRVNHGICARCRTDLDRWTERFAEA